MNISPGKTTFMICAKANAAQAFIKRNINYCPTHIKSNCYKTFVRPISEYESPIWAPHLQKDISALEKVQRTAARYAMNNYSWRSSVTKLSRLAHSQISSSLFQVSYVLQNIQRLHRSSISILISNSNIHQLQRSFTML